MAGDIQQLLSQIALIADEITDALGVDPANHGMLRGTLQMALAEAQGCTISKGPAIGSSLQSTLDLANRGQTTIFTRAQVTGSFDHFNSMRNTANGLATRLADIQKLFGHVDRLAPEAGRIARQGYQPLMSTAGERVQLAQEVEQAVVEINNSGGANRLSAQLITETGREAEFLAENQLQRRGVSLLPNAISQGRVLMQRISALPLNSQDARDMVKDIVSKGATGMTLAYNALRVTGTAARAAARTAFEVVGEFLIAFGAKLISIPLVPAKQFKKDADRLNGQFDPDDGA